jgi:hypothetical protein
MGWMPNYQSEGRIYARYILDHFPDAKIAVFWQNDDSGKDQFKGLRDGLGDKASMIIADKSYEVTDPSIDSQIVTLRDSGADTLFSLAAPKGSAQAIRKVGEIGWKVLPGECVDIRRQRAEARRPAICEGCHIDSLSEGPDRSGLERRSGRARVAVFHG